MAKKKENKNRIISIVGMCGSGKTDASEFLKEKGLSYIRFGDITIDYMKEKRIEINEVNERPVREGLRKEHGMAVYAMMSIPKIKQALATGDVIADGLYSWEEYLLLKQEFGNSLVILSIIASQKTRIKRLSTRKVRPISAADVMSRDKSEIENLNKGGPLAMADYAIINEGTEEDFLGQMGQFWAWLNK